MGCLTLLQVIRMALFIFFPLSLFLPFNLLSLSFSFSLLSCFFFFLLYNLYYVTIFIINYCMHFFSFAIKS